MGKKQRQLRMVVSFVLTGLALLVPASGRKVAAQEFAKPVGKAAVPKVVEEPDLEAAATEAVKTAASRAEIFTRAAARFGQAIHGLPEGFVDISKEEAAWDAGEKFLGVMIRECEDLLKRKKDVIDAYRLAAPAFAEARAALQQVKEVCEKEATEAKSDRQRADALFWGRLCQAALVRNDQNAAAAKEIFKDVQRYATEADEDLKDWRKGLQVVKLVRTPLSKVAGLGELHGRFREYAKRREQAKAAFKALLDKLEKSSDTMPPVPNPQVGQKVAPVMPAVAAVAADVAPKLAASGPPAVASSKVTVVVPAEARLWVNNVEFRSSDTVRSFVTPPLSKGRRYAYDLKMELQTDARVVTHRALFMAGDLVRVDFNKIAAH